MICARSCCLLVGLGLAALNGGATGAEARRAHWVSLFDGRDLKGWTPKIRYEPWGEDRDRTFTVRGGTIAVDYSRYGGKFGQRFGHLAYKLPFSTYRLRLKYRFFGTYLPDVQAWQHSNSGLMFHGQAPTTMTLDQSFPNSLEFQLLGSDGQSHRPTGNLCTPGTNVTMNGVVVKEHCTNSSSATYPEGTWVSAELEVRPDGQVIHYIEGKEVLRYDRPRWDPGIGETVPADPGYPRIARGYLYLQSEGHAVQFKDIEIQEL